MPLLVLDLLGANASAYFRIAYGISSVVLIIPASVITALFAEGFTRPARLIKNSMRAIKLLGVLLLPAIIVIFVGGDKVLLLFGEEYSDSALSLLRVLILSSVPYAIIELCVVQKRIALEVGPVIAIYSLMSALVIGSSAGLMSRYGLSGLGLGWTAGYAATALVTGFLVFRWLRKARMEDVKSKEL